MMCARNMAIADLIGRMGGGDFYFRAEAGGGLSFYCGGSRASVSSDDLRSLSYLSSLHNFLSPDGIVLAWGAKEAFSLVKGRTGVSMELCGRLYDLSLISSYLSIGSAPPAGFRDAVELMKRCVSHPGWKGFSPFYSSVYVPLATEVIPSLENCRLVDRSARKCVYPSYVIEGQANGRLKALVLSDDNYNPHSMGPRQRRNLAPPGFDESFVNFDYCNMEVNVLQWLSGDPELGAILEGKEDPYTAIWSRVTKSPADPSKRDLCKEVFLPVVFGQGARSLASKVGVREEFASKIIDRMVGAFPVAFDWVLSQSPDGDNMAVDRFGRRRAFEGRELYKIRNFSVQSPASMICLKKLVRLHEALKGLGRVCFHVHDGYCVVCERNMVDSVSEAGIAALEEEDPMFPGLRLRATCRWGSRLEELKPMEKVAP